MSNALASLIGCAFANAIYPSGVPVSECTNDDGTTDHFQNTNWRDHGFTDLEYFTASLSFFTTQAFVYFLPSYLLAACQNPNSGVADAIVTKLLPPKETPVRPSYLAWWQLLSKEQQLIVVSFLKHMQSNGHAVPYNAIGNLEALVNAV